MVEGLRQGGQRTLADHGFERLRTGKGDHEVWWNPQTRQHVTVDSGMRSRFTAQETLKQAGIKVRL